jgi:hypothetical protein
MQSPVNSVLGRREEQGKQERSDSPIAVSGLLVLRGLTKIFQRE